MNTLRTLIIAAPLAAALGGSAYAATAAASLAAVPAEVSVADRHGEHGGVLALLRQLELSADQRAQVRSIHAQAKVEMDALRDASRINHQALLTTAPTDPSYAALIVAAKSNAASAVQLRSDLWSQVYALLTPQQRLQVPSLAAAAEQQRISRHAARDMSVTGPL